MAVTYNNNPYVTFAEESTPQVFSGSNETQVVISYLLVFAKSLVVAQPAK